MKDLQATSRQGCVRVERGRQAGVLGIMLAFGCSVEPVDEPAEPEGAFTQPDAATELEPLPSGSKTLARR